MFLEQVLKKQKVQELVLAFYISFDFDLKFVFGLFR